MNEKDREKKHELLNKIAELVKVASALGDATDDEQTKFIAETCKLVFIAGSKPETCVLLGEHIIHYLEDLAMVTGEITAREHLTQNVKPQLN